MVMRQCKNGRSKTFDIDGQRLLKSLMTSPKTKDKTLSEISIHLNYASGYVARCVNKNQISEKAAILIKANYDIDQSDYVKVDGVDFKTEKAPEQNNGGTIILQVALDTKLLEDIVKKSVVEAFKSL